MWVQKTSCMWKKYVWNPATCSFENGKYLASIMDDLAITCVEIIESYNKQTKTISIFQQILMKRKQSVKRKFYL